MAVTFAIGLTGCVSYEEKPLTPEEIIGQVETSRSKVMLANGETFTFSKAATWMSENSPVLKQLQAEYATVQSVADIDTPWPNPSLEAGQNIGSKLEPGAVNKTVPFVGLGFTIPISGRLGRQDDLNKVRAKQAFFEVNISHRELYLNLRKQYVNLYLANRRKVVQQEIYDASSQIAKLTKTLQAAGATTALDVGMMNLEASQAQLDLLRVNEDSAAVFAQLSSLIGVDANQLSNIPQNALPSIVRKPPSYSELKKMLILNQPDLVRLRTEYDVAERKLRLEVSKQYPDITFGGSQETEVGEKTQILGLSIGIDIPIFDRNQQGVAEAGKYREEVRQKYITQAHKVLAELGRALKAVDLSEQRKKLLKDVLVPQSKNNLKIAEQSLKSGGIDALKYLDVKRGQQNVLKEVMNVENDLWKAWIDLEQAVGYPLISFPGEEKSQYPNLPVNKETKDEE